MKLSACAAAACCLIFATVLRAIAADTQTELPNAHPAALAGTWRLASTRQHMTDGSVRPDPDLGARPSGLLMFDDRAKQMCTMIDNGDRPGWRDPAHPTDAEVRAIWDQTVAYCATWSIDASRGELVYRLETNHSPNLIGKERRRRFTLDGDRLILHPTPLPAGVVDWEVEWRRMPEKGTRRN